MLILVTSLKLHTHKPYICVYVHSYDQILRSEQLYEPQLRLTLKQLVLGQT